jgi:AhpD family alkylhydroperoxidase
MHVPSDHPATRTGRPDHHDETGLERSSASYRREMADRVDAARVALKQVTPKVSGAMGALHAAAAAAARDAGVEPELLEPVRIRASQVNGCAFCIDMHTKDARAGGETEQRIYALDAWACLCRTREGRRR